MTEIMISSSENGQTWTIVRAKASYKNVNKTFEANMIASKTFEPRTNWYSGEQSVCMTYQRYKSITNLSKTSISALHNRTLLSIECRTLTNHPSKNMRKYNLLPFILIICKRQTLFKSDLTIGTDKVSETCNHELPNQIVALMGTL